MSEGMRPFATHQMNYRDCLACGGAHVVDLVPVTDDIEVFACPTTGTQLRISRWSGRIDIDPESPTSSGAS